MGNIISDKSGAQLLGGNENISFSKIVNDSLLELDLYNLDPKIKDSTTDTYGRPRSNFEVDYTTAGLAARPKNSDGKLIDINGIPYDITKDEVFNNTNALLGSQDNSMIPQNPNYWKNISKFYNFKRGVCNATTNIPVNTTGVLFPTDMFSPTMSASTQKIQKCLKYGTTVNNTPVYSTLNIKVEGDMLSTFGPTTNPTLLGYGSPWYVFQSKNIDSIINRTAIDLASGRPKGIYGGTTNDFSTSVPLNSTIDNGKLKYNFTQPFYLDAYNAQYVNTDTGKPSVFWQKNPGQFPPELLALEKLDDGTLTFNYWMNTQQFSNVYEVLDPVTKSGSNLLSPLNPNLIGFYVTTNPDYKSTNAVVEDWPLNKPCKYIMYPIMIRDTTTYPTSTAAFNYLFNNNILAKSARDAYDVTPPPIDLSLQVTGTIPPEMNYYIYLMFRPGYTITKNNYMISNFPITPSKIKDIDPSTDTLNIGPNSLTNQTVYGDTLTPECSNILNGMITNSYVMADIAKYTKLSDILDPRLNTPSSGISKSFKNQKIVTDENNNIKIVPKNDFTSVYNNKTYYTDDSGGKTNSTISSSCDEFYDGLCNYYYYNDFIDGVTFNPTLYNKLTPNNSALFANNINYLGQHIPDCRCANAYSIRNPTKELMETVTSGNTQTRQEGNYKPIEYYYLKNKCNPVFGKLSQSGTQPPKVSGGYAFNIQRLFNIVTGIQNVLGFGGQNDPVNESVLKTDMHGSEFLYAKNARADNPTFNTYTCTQTQTIIATGNGGNVTIAGASLDCVFPYSPGSSSGGAGGAGGKVNNQASLSVTVNSPPVNLGDYTAPINPFQQLIATVTFPTPAYNFYSDNNPNYGFAFQPVTASGTSSIIFAAYACGDINDGVNPTQCNSTNSFTVLTPFLYGLTTNEYGINYKLYIMNLPGNTSNMITPSTPIPCMLQQFAMQITDVIPGKILTTDTVYLQFNIKFNCISRPVISYAVILTPLSTNSSSSPSPSSPSSSSSSSNSGVIKMTGIDFFSDVTNNKGSALGSTPSINPSLADGTLTIGLTSETIINPSAYTYKILLNPPLDGTNGISMNYSNNVSSIYSGINSSIDFGQFVSTFNNFTISYLDYNNNNQITLFPSSNATANFGTTIELYWSFSNRDNYKNFEVSYQIDTNNPVPISKTLYPITTNTCQFIIPIIANSKKISFMVKAVGSTSTSDKLSNTLTVTSTPAPSTFNGWNVLSNLKLKDISMGELSVSTSIDNYLNPTTEITYNAVMYDIINNKWLKGIITTQSTDTEANTNGVIFQLPSPPNSFATFSITDSTPAKNPITSSTKVEVGSSLIINWTLSANITSPIQAQIYLNDIIIGSFMISQQIGTYKFTLYDLTGLNANISAKLYVSIYKIFKSSDVSFTLTNPFISNSIVPTNNLVSKSTDIPYMYISSDGTNLNTINNINLTLTNPLNDNQYFNGFIGYNSPLSIETHIMKLKNVSYSLPIKINFSNVGSQFTNVIYGKIRKNKEHFGNLTKKNKLIEGFDSEYIGNVLRLDLSQTPNYQKSITVNYIFNGYNKVSITSLELYFGTMNVDASTFNISFLGSPLSTTPIDVEIGSVRVIGIMTPKPESKIFIPITIPGATTVYYSTNTTSSYGWANSFTLINNNDGYYSINPNDNSAISAANELALNPPTNKSNIAGKINAPGQSESGTDWLLWGGILLILIIIAVAVYFMYFKKSKKINIV